ncbi:TetR/AcrR family transcriptional regulator [Nocardia farcinica]|uniref:TetR/AcrR family transcriptional regulator n=1 Tax=Nocardia farcinica TaxID=37329 RepID=UPI001E617A0A|nr:TetR/AcrR family transcriptional regulator [Nocardia farcinica]
MARETMDRTRRPRADARRNYERLLTEADAVFRAEGAHASLEKIARRAGVAIGTLYGHFPTRRALVGVLLRERNTALFAAAEGLLADPDPGAALTRWVHAVIEHAAAYQGLAALLADGLGDEGSELHESCARMNALGEAILARARTVGAVRADVTADDLFALMNAAAWAREHLPRPGADRLVALTLAGMRAHP